MNNLWQRFRQRKLVQWAVAYAAAAFALLQGIDIVAQQFGWPENLQRGITLGLVLGFFVALVLAWYHAERGRQRVSGTELLILAAVLVTGGGLLWRYAGITQLAPGADMPPTASAQVATAVPAAKLDIPEKSIAVLPMANGSDDKDQQYFSDGLSEDLITALSQFAGLKVISRNSAFQFRGSTDDSATIGRKLGVAHLLEGSVRLEGGIVRISAALVTAADGSTSWSESYDRPYKDLFNLQDDISGAVAAALKAKLLAGEGIVAQNDRPPGGDLQAYGEYIKGDFHANRGTETDMRIAIDQYQAAIALDARYARAYAALASTWGRLATTFLGGRARQQANGKARAAADIAIAMDPQLAAGYVAQGYLLIFAEFDWIQAEAPFRKALSLSPNDQQASYWLAFLSATLGRPEEAVKLARRTLSTDPLRTGAYLHLSRYLVGTGHLGEAESAIQRAIELQPGASANYEQLTIIETLRGNVGTAIQAALREPPGVWQDAALALARQIDSDRKAADTALAVLIDRSADIAAYQIAEIFALRREPGKMFEWLERAWETHDPGISLLLFDPFILRYRDDPRFVAFCRKVGLPTTTTAQTPKD